MFFMLLAIIILLALNAYLLQDIRDKVYANKQVETKKKQFTREHTPVSKTNFRKYTKW